jgi:hypothetical protein
MKLGPLGPPVKYVLHEKKVILETNNKEIFAALHEFKKEMQQELTKTKSEIMQNMIDFRTALAEEEEQGLLCKV